MIRPSLLFILLICFTPLYSQVDTSFLAKARTNTINYYNNLIEDESALYTGAEYRLPTQTEAEYPYYVENNLPVPDEEFWKRGDIVFNQERYTDISIQYDIVQDMVIIENSFGDPIMLVKDKVSAFSLGKKNFIQIYDGEKQQLPRNGFYELLYEGATRVVGRHTKTRQERIENRTLLIYYPYRQRYYVRRNNVYYPISSRKDLLRLMEDRKTEVRAFIRDQKLVVSRKNPASFATVAAYYDNLTAGKQ